MSELTKDWKKVKLGDVAEFTNGGAWNSNEYTDSGISIVQVTNISNNTIVLDQCKFLLPESLMKYKKHMLFEGDLVIATVGSHPTQPNSVVGRVAIIPKFVQGSLLNQNAVRLSPKSKELDKKYLGHLGKSPFFRNYIIAHARGSANQVRMSIGLLKEMDIHLPPFFIQKKIASILSNYDDLIENNTRRIEILEEMAKLVYEEWFVKFRFPGHENVRMVPSELGEIPEGWEVKKLPDLCNKVIDGTHDSPKPSENGYFLVTGKHIVNSFIDFTECYRISSEEHFKVIQRSKPEKGDIIFSNIGTLGSIAIVDQDFEFSIKNVALFKPLEDFYSNYLYLHFSSPETYDQMMRKASGTSQKFFSLNFLRNLEIINPPKKLLHEFDKIIKPMIEERSLLYKKNQNLRKTRDLLLPKLISGEIDVSDMDIRVRKQYQEPQF